jgi:uridylate kinase
MLGTTMNALAVCDVLEQHGIPAVVQNALDIQKVSEPYNRVNAVKHLEQGTVVVFAGGSGCPFFSTDTAAALRAAEIDADAILLAKNIDGVYDADPAKVPTAKKFDRISYAEVLARNLKVMDTTATALAMDTRMPVLVFALKDPANIKRVLMGEQIGTYVGFDE